MFGRLCLGDLSEDEFRQLGDMANSASAGMVKDLERIATLSALSAADPNVNAARPTAFGHYRHGPSSRIGE